MLITFYILLMLRVGRCTDEQFFETKTVQLGDNVNLPCTRKSTGTLFWIRLVPGHAAEVLARTFSFMTGDPHITAREEPGKFVLHIAKAKQSDTAVYYCAKIQHKNLTFLKGIDLTIIGKYDKKESEPGITAVPPYTENSVSLWCSVLSDSENETCPNEKCVCYFRAGSQRSHPSIIYPQGNSTCEYERNPEVVSTKKRVFPFSKNISFSDAGTCYCAVATCGTVKGSKLYTEVNVCHSQRDNTVLFLLCAALAISLIVIAFLIFSNKKLKKNSKGCYATVDLQTDTKASGCQESQQMGNHWFILQSFSPVRKLTKQGQGKQRQQKKRVSTLMSELLSWINSLNFAFVTRIYVFVVVFFFKSSFVLKLYLHVL
ncbi:uncharacterized protein LOC120785253 isoform X2 [Xiphias gladius]|uniref:uncharacterized protein LOC120785253 isoform X2 n=1 Tax=Xiphias gladius TaxID=8245 RepID=UPI001A984714|nr:uncharacterized protein LOC120785253 isoform X2 [Xiphias gladius]